MTDKAATHSAKKKLRRQVASSLSPKLTASHATFASLIQKGIKALAASPFRPKLKLLTAMCITRHQVPPLNCVDRPTVKLSSGN